MTEKNNTQKPFSDVETAAFCEQLSVILTSGISILEGLTILRDDAESASEQKILQTIIDEMIQSDDFSKALDCTGLFPDYMVRMVSIGSETGRLDDVLLALTLHYERAARLHKGIRDAITYPSIMTGMIAVVVIVLLVKVLPVFNQVFIQLGYELTGFSKILMNIGTTIGHSATGLVILLCLLVIAGALAFGTARGQKILSKIGYRIPSIAQLMNIMASCRFASCLSLTLSSGLHPERGLELARSLNQDEHFEKKLNQCDKLLNEGVDFPEALKQSEIFTGVYARMALVGEKTGSMDSSMKRIADLYQEEIDQRINNVLSILEPTLVIILSVIVGVVLLSVMLPLIGIMSSM